MPKDSAPKTDLEAALAPAFERAKKLQTAARKIARAISDLSPQQARAALEMVLEAQNNVGATPPPAEDGTAGA